MSKVYKNKYKTENFSVHYFNIKKYKKLNEFIWHKIFF